MLKGIKLEEGDLSTFLKENTEVQIKFHKNGKVRFILFSSEVETYCLFMMHGKIEWLYCVLTDGRILHYENPL